MFSSSGGDACRLLPTYSTSIDELDNRPEIGLTTHRVTYSDRLKVFLGPHEDIGSFLRPMRRMDGHHRFSLTLTRLPEPVPADEITTTIDYTLGTNALHCAGSADAMLVQLHTTVDGEPHHYTLGRPGDRTGLPTVFLPHGDRDTYIYPGEVFDFGAAARVFRTYFETGSAPGDLHHREMFV